MRLNGLMLAAGRSTRMGFPKLSATRHGFTLLQHSLGRLRAGPVQRIVLVLGPGEAAPDGADLEIVRNPEPAAGLSASLSLGFRAAARDAEAVFVALADMPEAAPETCYRLAQAFRPGLAAVVPRHDERRGHPVLVDAAWGLGALAGLEGDRGFGPALARAGTAVREVEVDDPGVLFDIDAPEQMERWRSAVRDPAAGAGRH